jgi:hypothetical protein
MRPRLIPIRGQLTSEVAMLPQSLLSKIKLSAGAASMVFMFSNAACAEEKPAAASPPVPIEVVAEPKLTEEQLKLLRTNLPLLAAENFDVREMASAKIQDLGKASVASLKEALKSADDAETMIRIKTIIADLTKSKSKRKRPMQTPAFNAADASVDGERF